MALFLSLKSRCQAILGWFSGENSHDYNKLTWSDPFSPINKTLRKIGGFFLEQNTGVVIMNFCLHVPGKEL